jgi:hypothetical protein
MKRLWEQTVPSFFAVTLPIIIPPVLLLNYQYRLRVQ